MLLNQSLKHPSTNWIKFKFDYIVQFVIIEKITLTLCHFNVVWWVFLWPINQYFQSDLDMLVMCFTTVESRDLCDFKNQLQFQILHRAVFPLWPESIKRMYKLQRKTWNCISRSICIFQKEFFREVYLYKSNRNKFKFSEFHRNYFYLHIWLGKMVKGHFSLFIQQYSMETVLKTFVF